MSALDVTLDERCEIEYDEDFGEYRVSHPVVNAYGEGDTVESAVEDCRMMMLDMYSNLSKNADRLSPRMERELKALGSELEREGVVLK